MIQSDTLSRRPDFIPNDDSDNEEMTILPNNLFINVDLQQWIANCTATDKDTADALITLVKDGPSSLKNQLDDWMIEPFEGKNILFYKGKNYIPQDQDLRRDIARIFHDHETAGHPGELETYNAIVEYYEWYLFVISFFCQLFVLILLFLVDTYIIMLGKRIRNLFTSLNFVLKLRREYFVYYTFILL